MSQPRVPQAGQVARGKQAWIGTAGLPEWAALPAEMRQQAVTLLATMAMRRLRQPGPAGQGGSDEPKR
jgi:hypothetical protein